MRRKWAVLSIAVLSLVGLSAAPAAASGGDFAPPGCFGERYGILFGQGVSVSCFPGAGYGYRVIAHCTTGSAFWFVVGRPVPYGFGPAVAECEGSLLAPVELVAYQVDEI
ncbi:hypothetical protein [Amycolatopsis sp. NPDC004625]|uniref:hypothetical protein n=1 Tax=Amycolatopsis sp. NPDC004625 TaxID=3154670 RepID=UPI0033A251F7